MNPIRADDTPSSGASAEPVVGSGTSAVLCEAEGLAPPSPLMKSRIPIVLASGTRRASGRAAPFCVKALHARLDLFEPGGLRIVGERLDVRADAVADVDRALLCHRVKVRI